MRLDKSLARSEGFPTISERRRQRSDGLVSQPKSRAQNRPLCVLVFGTAEVQRANRDLAGSQPSNFLAASSYAGIDLDALARSSCRACTVSDDADQRESWLSFFCL